jgi:hypothetical protein
VTVGVDGQEEHERLDLTDDDRAADQAAEPGDRGFDGVFAQLVACPRSSVAAASL